MHIQIFDTFFSSLAHSSAFLVLFHILRAVPYSSKGFRVCALNMAQFLVSILCSACMWCNGSKGTAPFATEVQNRRAVFAAAILRTKKPFWGHSRGNVVRNCSRTAMENYSAQCRTWCGAMPKQRGQNWTHRCSPLCTRMISRTIMENYSAQCRTWCVGQCLTDAHRHVRSILQS